jgi:hypothetical protein
MATATTLLTRRQEFEAYVQEFGTTPNLGGEVRGMVMPPLPTSGPTEHGLTFTADQPWVLEALEWAPEGAPESALSSQSWTFAPGLYQLHFAAAPNTKSLCTLVIDPDPGTGGSGPRRP